MSTQASDGPIKNRDVKRKAKIDGLKLDFYKATAQTSTTLAVYGHGADSGDPKGGGLWFDASANAWKATYNNGTIATLASSSTTGTLNDAYTNGASITITSATPVVLGNAQTNGTASLDINLTGDQAGAANVSVIDIDVSAQTGSGTHAGVDVAFSTDGSGTPVGVLVAMNLAAQSAFTATKGSVTLTDGDLTLSAGNATITSDATTGTGLKVNGSTITSGDVLQVVCVSGTMGATGSAISVLDGSTEKFRVAEDGATTIAGTAAGTAAETITAGDLVLTDGRVRATCTTNSTYTSAAFTFDPSSVTDGHGIYVDGTSVTSGTIVAIEYDASTMSGGKILDIIDNDGPHASSFSIADLGAVTIGSQASRTTSGLTITQGTITLTSGDLVGTSTDVSITTQATTGTYGGGSANSAVYVNASTVTTGYGVRIEVDDATMSTGKPLAVTVDDTEVWAVSKTGAQAFASAVNMFTLDVNAGSSASLFDINYVNGLQTGKCFDIEIGNAASTLTVLDISMSGATTVGACAININAGTQHTAKIINLDTQAVMYDNRGVVEIDHSIGVLVAGSSLLRVSSSAALVNATSSLVNIEMSAATAAVALLVEGGAVARTTSLVSINDSTTSTGASLYVSSASASTAKIAHIVASSASFTGNAVYIDVGTASQHCKAIYIDATSAHNTDCVYITSTGVLANNKGVLNIEHAGVLANAGAAVVRIVEGAVNVTQGSMLEVDAGATATGVYGISVIGGAAARTSALVNISDATSSTGASLNVATSDTDQTNVVLFAISNVAGTGNLLKLDVGGASTVGETALAIDATSAHTVQTINIDTAGIVADDVGVVEIDHSTGEIVAGGSLLRVDSDKALANACALVNIDMSAATAAYALWIEGGAAARTSDLINIDDNTSDSGNTLSIARVASSGNMINLSVGAYAYTGTAIAIDLGNASTTGAKAMTIDVSNAQTTDVIAITSTAVLANNLGVLNITNTGVMANDGAAIIRVDSTAVQNVGGALCELTDNSASTAGAILRVASSGARTADVVNITTAAAVLAQDKGVINLNHTGVMAHDEAALIRVVNNSAQTTGGAMLELQDAAASTAGAVLRISGAGARTADVVNITTAATVLAQDKAVINLNHTGVMAHDEAALIRVVNNSIQTTGAMLELQDAGASTGSNVLRISSANAARTGDVVSITSTSTGTSDCVQITESGAGSGSLINLQVGAAAYTGTALNIYTGDAATVASRAIAIDATNAQTTDVIYVNTTAVLANNKGVLNIEHTGILAHDGAAVVRIVEGAANSLQGSMLEVDTGATATGIRGISVLGGAVARTSSLVKIADSSTNGLGCSLEVTSVATGDANVVSFVASNSAHTGDVLYVESTAATGGYVMAIQASGASTKSTVYIESAAVLAADQGVLNVTATGVRAHADASTVRVKTSAIQTQGAMLELDDSGASTGGNILAIKSASATRNASTTVNDLVSIVDSAAGSHNTMTITASAAGSGKLLDLQIGAVAYTGTALNIYCGDAATVASRAIAIDVTNAQTTDVIYVNSTAVLADNKAVLNIEHNGVMANDGAAVIRVVNAALQNVGGALLELDDAGASTAGNVLRISASNAARTGDIIAVTNTSTGASDMLSLTQSGAGSGSLANLVVGAVAYTGTALNIDIGDAATVAARAIAINATNAQTTDVIYVNSTAVLADNKAVLNIEQAGILADDGAAVIRVVNSVVQTTGALVDLEDAGASTGSNILRISASNAARTGDIIAVTNTSTSSSDIISITQSGANSGCLVNCVVGAAAYTGNAISVDIGDTATACKGIFVDGGTGARTTALVDIVDAGTNAGHSLSITTSGTGAVHYGLYINATGAQAEALKVDAGAAVFDENVTITGTAILGENTIYVRSDAAGVLSLTTADAAPSESNQAQLRFLPRNVTDAGPMTATGGQESEIVYNLSDNKLYVCTTSHASAATWALIGGQTA